jgi:periplasmic protein TonB
MKSTGSTCDVGRRQIASILASCAVHAVAVLFLLALYQQGSNSLHVVEMDVWSTKPPVVEPPRTPPPQAPEPEKLKPSEPLRLSPPQRTTPETTQTEESPPPDGPPTEDVPAVFDIADSSFAEKDQPAALALSPSEGNTHIGQVATSDGTSVRGTSPTVTRSPVTESSTDFHPEPRGNLTRRPEPRKGSAPLPPYPAKARREGIEGKVRLRVSIGKDGRVRDVVILSDPGGGLGESASRAMKDLLWLPALGLSGTPVDSVIVYTYNFVLR